MAKRGFGFALGPVRERAMSEVKVERRVFLVTLAGVGSLAGLAAVGCGKGAPAAGGAELNCTDTAGLSDAEKTGRAGVKYVDKSEIADKNCSNCTLFEPAEGKCGACKVVKGPINPKGYCITWAAKA